MRPSSRRYLRPGMSVLNMGCGPGTITQGLAELVAPGRVVGIDMQPALIERAHALAASRGQTNLRFEVADLYDLPFRTPVSTPHSAMAC